MGRYGEQLRRMSIETRSPDRTVILRYSGDGNVALNLARGCLAKHTEGSLAGQVRAVIRVAIAARAQGRQQAWRNTASDLGHDVDHPDWGHDTISRTTTPFGRYLAANNSLEVTGVSAGRRVRVSRDGDGEVSVEIRPGTLAQAGEESVAAEIRSAILAVLADHRQRNRELVRRILGADIERIIFGGSA